MYSEERKAEIIRILDENGKVSVEELADKYQTSRETIRRDLKDLEAKGALTRTHGGAVPRKVYDGIPAADQRSAKPGGEGEDLQKGSFIYLRQ